MIQEGSSVTTAKHLLVLQQQIFLLFAYDKLSLMATSCLALVKIHLSPTWKMNPGRKESQKYRKTELSQETTIIKLIISIGCADNNGLFDKN